MNLEDKVKKTYAGIAMNQGSCCGPAADGCCGATQSPVELSGALGYSKGTLKEAPEGANLGLGCGNPGGFAAIQPGEVVLDIGSGPGLDSFISAGQVGSDGRVIGVDMTQEMIDLAKKNASGDYENVEFRLGKAGALPVDDESVDVIISNCVINLAQDKEAVFREAFRVLKPGGRLAVSDVVAHQPLPERIRGDSKRWCACISGAPQIQELEKVMEEAGFEAIAVEPVETSKEVIDSWAPGEDFGSYVCSATIQAVKPAG